MDAKVDAARAAEVQAVVEESEKRCIVCFKDYTVGKEKRRLPCGHGFHASCIEKWFHICRSTHGMNPDCPICGADVDRAVR